MNRLDVVIVLLAAMACVAGWRLGLARRILGWAGLWVGLVVASQVLPHVMPSSSARNPSTFLVGAAVLIALALGGQLAGSVIGARIRKSMSTERIRSADSALGAVAGLLGLVLVAWVVVPTMSNIAGWPAQEVRTSAVAKAIDSTLGQPPSLFSGLSRSLGPNPFPRVFDRLAQDNTKITPPASSPLSQVVLDSAAASVVKLSGTVCGRTQSGSGFAAAGDLVVTNAHVVAGLTRITVSTRDDAVSDATVVAFDPKRDLAVVRLRTLRLTPLSIADAEVGETGVVLGYPGGGRLTVAPFRIAQRLDAQGRDIYDRDPVLRRILVMGAEIAPGDSGGPLIDAKGAVAGLAFAIAPDRPLVAYAIRTEEVRAIVGGRLGGTVSTGDCLE